MAHWYQQHLSSVTSATVERTIQSLRTIIREQAPVTYGTCSIPTKDFTLYYGRSDGARRIHLHNASPAEMELLLSAAVSRVNNQDVYAENDRKAGSLDVEDFATNFNVERSGILARMKNDLLDRESIAKSVDCELYKLSVCGEGGCFKVHKDSPKSANMFGSLVIVFPVPHTGGAVLLRRSSKFDSVQEWKFDSGRELATVAQPSVGYAAFSSDVEHEVAFVQSGYRVALTYNLFLSGDDYSGKHTLPASKTVDVHETAFKAEMEKLLVNPTFLPHGGCIGFGLQHEYPINNKTKASALAGCLKGNDAVIERVFRHLALPIQPKIHTASSKNPDSYLGELEAFQYLTDSVVTCGGYEDVDSLFARFLGEKGVLLARLPDGPSELSAYYTYKIKKNEMDNIPIVDVEWITCPTKYNRIRFEFAYEIHDEDAYEKSVGSAHLSGSVCLIARIGPPGKRV
ncbi:uncharacterized protein LOC129592094 [Paramacrobiotus metropolitanus]|uniref:uncharacterized protein LOC129592094 n=1 Tax=Paramacrobiotus metropolitanus TaxID=2943436 RepID=UPI0024463642|nr:uncharacterized protein LOC129592094 [Paramacrobiotus metropolitanus]